MKYRGIFLNDEAPALDRLGERKVRRLQSSSSTRKVFELIAPAEGQLPLAGHVEQRLQRRRSAENPRLADEYGIVMGTSHHEPMLRAQQEWKRHGNGPWDYATNADVLRRVLAKASRNKNYESIITSACAATATCP